MPVFARFIRITFLLMSLGWVFTTVTAQDSTKIVLEQADSWEYDEDIGPNIQRIIGNVILRHDTGYLYCDSAYLNDIQNVVLAYGHVHIKSSDTLNLYGDSLEYNGNTRIAEVWGNVRLIDNQTILTTDSLEYDRKSGIAWYDNWGKIVNDDNNLVSKFGYYYTNDKEFFFKEKVILMNPDYVMNSDTLMYNTVTEIAYFYGPSTIVSKDKVDSIWCTDGWYDTRKDICRFSKRAQIYHEAQFLTGDTIYYERINGFGEVRNNALMLDSIQDVGISGHYGEIDRRIGEGFMTNRATGLFIDKADTLFLYGDTIKALFEKQNESEQIKSLFAYNRVKFYRKDLQGSCDSLAYHSVDSTMFMYHDPVIWSEKNQMTADTISMTIRNEALDSMVMYKSAFIISRDDLTRFNQIKGKDMTAWFVNNELYKIKVIGNSETIYFVREEDKTLIGVNKLYASDMLIYVKDNEIQTITYIREPAGTLYPEKDISPYDLKLKGFEWLHDIRPQSKADIYP